MPEVYLAWAIDWTEWDRRWGQRPDGLSFHATKEAAIQYGKDHFTQLPDRHPPAGRDAYTNPGIPYSVVVRSTVLRQRIEEEVNVMFRQANVAELEGDYERIN